MDFLRQRHSTLFYQWPKPWPLWEAENFVQVQSRKGGIFLAIYKLEVIQLNKDFAFNLKLIGKCYRVIS